MKKINKARFNFEYKNLKITYKECKAKMYEHYNDKDTYYCTLYQNNMLEAGTRIRIYEHFISLFPETMKDVPDDLIIEFTELKCPFCKNTDIENLGNTFYSIQKCKKCNAVIHLDNNSHKKYWAKEI